MLSLQLTCFPMIVQRCGTIVRRGGKAQSLLKTYESIYILLSLETGV